MENESGEAKNDARVTLLDAEGFAATRSRTRKVDPQGRFSFRGLRPGRYRVTATTTTEPRMRGASTVAIASDESHVIVKLTERISAAR